MRNWLAALLAGLLVVAVGSALASTPSGSNAAFNVNDPAVTVVAAGQASTLEGVSPSCSFEAKKLKYCFQSELTFTPATSATCLVNADIGLIGEPMGKEAGLLNNVGYGIGVRVGGKEGEDKRPTDGNGITATPNYLSMATMPRSRLVPVEAGVSYTFEPWIYSYETAKGTAYWDLTYVCFG